MMPVDPYRSRWHVTAPYLTRSALHRSLRRHGISRLPDIAGDKPKRQHFKRYPNGFFHLDIVELQSDKGKLYFFVAIDRRTIRGATVKGFHYDSHEQSKDAPQSFHGCL